MPPDTSAEACLGRPKAVQPDYQQGEATAAATTAAGHQQMQSVTRHSTAQHSTAQHNIAAAQQLPDGPQFLLQSSFTSFFGMSTRQQLIALLSNVTDHRVHILTALKAGLALVCCHLAC